MEPSFSPLNVPPQGSSTAPVPPSPPSHSKKKINTKMFGLLALLVLFVGVIGGYIAMSSGLFYNSQASGDGTVYWTKGKGHTMGYDGRQVTIQDANKSIALKLVMYKANQPYWGQAWGAIGAPSVTNVSNGSTVEVPCGYFQADLIPQSAQVYQAPSYTGDRYGNPGADVLLAAINGTRTCTSSPTPKPPTATPKPPTSTPKPSATLTPKPPTATPTRNPVCGSTCTSDSQCATGMKCYNSAVGTYTTPTGKCVLAKCLVAGTVCSADKCTVIPPTNTPTPKPSNTPMPSNTPRPSVTNVCPKPNPVKNLRINCPICQGL